eukprot:s1436_g6.t3
MLQHHCRHGQYSPGASLQHATVLLGVCEEMVAERAQRAQRTPLIHDSRADASPRWEDVKTLAEDCTSKVISAAKAHLRWLGLGAQKVYAQIANDVLRRVFQATLDIQASGRVLEGSRSHEMLATHLSPEASVQDFQEALHPKRNESNVEQLLREWDSLKRVTSQNLAPAVMLGEKERAAMETAMDDAELLALKHAEISGWYVSTGLAVDI